VTDVIDKEIKRLHECNRSKKVDNTFLEYRINFRAR
jgi:hypothetical protein